MVACIGSQSNDPKPAPRLADLKSISKIGLALGVPTMTTGKPITFTNVTKKLSIFSTPPERLMLRC
ncbi:hypothetical protein D3C73_1019750 [compost metagenome]